MVGVGALRQANWAAVEDAAKAWKVLADQATFARDDITQRGAGPVDEHWPDAVGQAAGQHLKGLADKYDSAGLLLNSVGMVVLDGIANAIEIAQDQLATAFELAAQHQFHVADDGAITWVGPGLPEMDPANTRRYEIIRGLVSDAIEAAAQADTRARDELVSLSASTNATPTLNTATLCVMAASMDGLRKRSSPGANRMFCSFALIRRGE